MHTVEQRQFEELLPRLITRDPVAEEKFFTIAYSRLTDWAKYKFRVPEEAREDFVLEVIEKVLRRIQSFRPTRARFTTWMFTVARNHRLDQLRAFGAGGDPLVNSLPIDVLDWLEGQSPMDSDAQLSDATVSATVQSYKERLSRLAKADLEFLELACATTLTSAEIASQTSMSASAVRKRKERLLAALRDEFQNEKHEDRKI